MTIKPWSIISEELIDVAPYRRVLIREYLLPNGTKAQVSLKDEDKVVTIFPVTQSNEVIMCRQFRPGPGIVLDELPAGIVEGHEQPLEAARRELLEETGFESDEWILLGNPLECAYSTIERHAFLAKNCYRSSKQILDQEEDIEVILKSTHDLITQSIQGLLSDPEVAWMGLWKIGAVLEK